MARPTAVQTFRRLAYQRLEEADVLLKHGYTTGSVYLSGYAIECMLKALALAAVPTRMHKSVLADFRGRSAHSYEWLRRKYLKGKAPTPPKEVVRALASVATWSTDLRYEVKRKSRPEAVHFLNSVRQIVQWCEATLP